MKLIFISCTRQALEQVTEIMNKLKFEYFDEFPRVVGQHGSLKHFDTRVFPGDLVDLLVMADDGSPVEELFLQLQSVKKELQEPEGLRAFVIPVEKTL